MSEFYKDSALKIFNISLTARLAELTEKLEKELHGTVYDGPFKGMHAPNPTEQGLTSLNTPYRWNAPKLLGCYESHLHNSLEKAIQRNPEVVVNIGCGEGYYTVGLAQRLPEAHIYAFDISSVAQDRCALAAEKNDVAERITIGGLCTQETLLNFAKSEKKTLFIIDCEGGERALFNDEVAKALSKCDLIIECHDFQERNTTAKLCEFFMKTHEITFLKENTCNQKEIPLLHFWNSFDRALLTCEFRPEIMIWLACWSH